MAPAKKGGSGNQCCGSASIIMRIRIQDSKNVFMVGDGAGVTVFRNRSVFYQPWFYFCCILFLNSIYPSMSVFLCFKQNCIQKCSHFHTPPPLLCTFPSPGEGGKMENISPMKYHLKKGCGSETLNQR